MRKKTLFCASAISTLKKRPTGLDVFLNVCIPFTCLLFFEVLQYCNSVLITSIITGCIILGGNSWIEVWFDENLLEVNKLKKLRLCYYKSREIVILSLIIFLTPITLWCQYKSESFTYFSGYVNSEEIVDESEETSWSVVDEKIWESLNVYSRFMQVEEIVEYMLRDLGIEQGVSVWAVKENRDYRLGYYDEISGSICISVNYLASAHLSEVIKLIAHETMHYQQMLIVEALKTVEELGTLDLGSVECFQQMLMLKKAKDRYQIDKESYKDYKENYLEIKADAYAENTLKDLKTKGYLE
jgi:hypothetical protein